MSERNFRKEIEEGGCQSGCNAAKICVCGMVEDMADEIDRLRARPSPSGESVTDEMILACIKASDSMGLGADKGSFLWEMTEKGLRAALAVAAKAPSPREAK